ncbi:MAG: FAD binding domain-containing protein, partial [Acidimicrobiia bacterium]
MIPAPFEYVRAASVDEALAALAEHGDEAKLLAGGMSLLPLMKLRLARPSVLVDVGRLRDLSYVRDEGDHVAIGALTRHRDLETNELLCQQCGVLPAVASEVGDNQVRHRGTIGGSVAHGDPASDLPATLLALDATFVARGPGGERTLASRDLFEGFLETALAPEELLTEIRVPKTGGRGFSYQKF